MMNGLTVEKEERGDVRALLFMVHHSLSVMLKIEFVAGLLRLPAEQV